MQAIDTIPTNCDYFFMREGVKPMWEDPANVGGGELRMTVVKAADGGAIWLNALLFAVGSQATSHEIINGIQFAFRPGRNRLSLWTAATTPANLDQLKLEFTSMIQGIVGEETNIRMEFNAFNKHGGGHGHGRGPSSQDHHQSSSGTTRPSSSSQHDGRARSDVKSSRSFSGSGGDSSKGGGGADGRGRFSGSFSRPGDTGNFGSRR